MTAWGDYLDALEEWVRRADDPSALPPHSAPTTPAEGADAFRARVVLALMERRQLELQTDKRLLLQAVAYARS